MGKCLRRDKDGECKIEVIGLVDKIQMRVDEEFEDMTNVQQVIDYLHTFLPPDDPFFLSSPVSTSDLLRKL